MQCLRTRIPFGFSKSCQSKLELPQKYVLKLRPRTDSKLVYVRNILSVVILIIFALVTTADADSANVPVPLSLGMFVFYILISAYLISSICSRLFGHHRLTAFRFDIATIILVTTLVALPFGYSKVSLQAMNYFSNSDIADDPILVYYTQPFLLTGTYFFLWLPILSLTEFLFSNLSIIVNDANAN